MDMYKVQNDCYCLLTTQYESYHIESAYPMPNSAPDHLILRNFLK